MNGLVRIAVAAALIVGVASVAPPAAASGTKADKCAVDASGGLFGGSQGVTVEGTCAAVVNVDDNGHSGPPTRTIDCGYGLVVNGWNPACGTGNSKLCLRPGTGTTDTTIDSAFGTQTKTKKGWGTPTVWCPGDPLPALTMAAVRDQAIRLLPHVHIGSAWTTTALVNAEVIFWADTPVDRTLPTATVVGHHVALRVHLDHAHWNFGDTTTDTTTNPGKTYDPTHDPCRTPQCPHYYGHTYHHTGTRTVTLTITWHAQFAITATTWTDINTPITGPTDRHTITIKQARGILIPNPGEH